MTRLKIALLAGGDSPEREIALQSAALIEAALDHSKYDITVIDLHGRDWHHTAPDGRQWQVDKNDFSITVDGVRKAFDYALIIIHGTPGEDGKLQGYLDMMGVPYSSCSMTSSVITFDKITAKRTLAGRVNLAREVFLRRGEAFDPAQIVAELGETRPYGRVRRAAPPARLPAGIHRPLFGCGPAAENASGGHPRRSVQRSYMAQRPPGTEPYGPQGRSVGRRLRR